ncbi:histidinol-phosphate transaminase [Pseudomonadota bacterium]
MKQKQELNPKILNLVRKNIRKLKVYDPLIPENKKDVVLLNQNENPYSIGLEKFNCKFNRYPELQPKKLIKILSNLYKTNSKNVLLTRGADEGIDILVKSFCECEKDGVLICPPTFGMYKVFADIQGVKTFKVPLLEDKDFQLDVKSILETVKNNSIKVIFIPNPSAPMGNIIKKESLITLCEKLKNDVVVVVDEAYIEFTKIQSFIESLNKYHNLIVLRTLSKTYGMAGLRLGSIIAHEKLISIFKAVQPPYALSILSIKVAEEILKSGVYLNKISKNTDKIISERKRMEKELEKFSFVKKIYPSVTNFLFLQVDDSEKLFKFCYKNGFAIRSQTSQIPNAIRISIGTPEENNKLINLLNKY